jgi:dihydropteroate synthase
MMGILNVTPDSFSDGGKYLNIETAIDHALKMIEEGADIIDIGGESTRPGSERVDAEEQKKRTIDVISELKITLPVHIVISIDTTLSEVAESALNAGASIINDISAGRDDPEIMILAADRRCPYIIMHMQGEPKTMQNNPVYKDVVAEIKDFLMQRVDETQKAGIKKENIVIDPGIGFGKTEEHNLELLNKLDEFVDTGYPVLLGTSRKRFMGSICENASADELIGATCATTALGVSAGVKLFRVHDVKDNRQAADIAWSIINS